jgi:hypothetical protein
MDALALVTVIAGIVVPTAELVGGKLLKLDGDKARLLSWFIGVLLGLGAGVLGLAPDLVQGGLLGFLAALVANGIFTADQVKRLLEALKLREPGPVAMAPQGVDTKPIDQRVEDILRNRR